MIAGPPIRQTWERRSKEEMEKKLHSTLDREWERLIREARQRGLTPHDVRCFLAEKQREKNVYDIKQVSGGNS